MFLPYVVVGVYACAVRSCRQDNVLFCFQHFVKLLGEEHYLIVYRVAPVVACVAAGTHVEVVLNVEFAQTLVGLKVNGIEKVAVSAVDYDVLARGEQPVERIVYGVRLPHCLVLKLVAQHLLYLPAVGILADVHASARGAYVAEHVGMLQSVPHGSVSAHAKARYGSQLAARVGGVVGVDILGQFL